jgi:hypothetical protein
MRFDKEKKREEQKVMCFFESVRSRINISFDEMLYTINKMYLNVG